MMKIFVFAVKCPETYNPGASAIAWLRRDGDKTGRSAMGYWTNQFYTGLGPQEKRFKQIGPVNPVMME
jgi:hypothetical protein